MKVSIPHSYSQIGAITHIKKVLNTSRAQMAEHLTGVSEEWKENVLIFGFTAQKQHITGTLTVLDKSLELYAKLPLTLRLFEGKIERMIQEESKKVLKQ